MKSRLYSLGLVAGVIGIGVGFAACSSSSNNGGGGGSSCSSPTLQLDFDPGYSGTDGTEKFQIPMRVLNDSSGNSVSAANQGAYTWTASPASAITISATDPSIDPALGGVMVTVNNTLTSSETVTLTATETKGGACGTTTINLAYYDAGLYALGAARYNNGATIDGGAAIPDPTVLLPYVTPTNLPAGLDAGAIALRIATATATAVGSASQPCKDCHQASSNPTFASGISHTPEQTGGYSDTELMNAYVNGVIYDGGLFEAIPLPSFGGTTDAGLLSEAEWGLFHHWTFDSPEQELGVLVYLRALAPAPSGGGLERAGGGGGHGDGGYTPHDGGGGFGGDGGAPPPPPADGGSVTPADASSGD